MKENINDLMNSEAYKNHKKKLDEKKKTIKNGENVVHINYYEGILNKDDLKEYSVSLEKIELQLSSYDKNGVMYASLEEYSNLMNVVLTDELTKNILYGVAGNLIWDTIKTLTKKIFTKVKNKNLNHLSGGRSKKKNVTFWIHLSLNEYTGFDFRLDGKFNSKTIEKSLEQATEFVKVQTPKEKYDHPLFLYYDHKKKEWVAVDMIKEIKQKVANKNRKTIKK